MSSREASERIFRCLSLCTRPPGGALDDRALRTALREVASWHALLDSAELHGLEALFAAHLRAARIHIPAAVSDRLKARSVQHAHALAVRRRVVADSVAALEHRGIPVLVLKGAALAQLVYAHPLLRPMNDVDVLVPPQDARHGWDTLRRLGFSASGTVVRPSHHHLQGLTSTQDGVTVMIELHTELFARTPFVTSLRYHDLDRASQTFEWNGLRLRTLGREDMLWHIYAHAFVINVFWRGVRLIAIADLIHATEAWLDLIDWDDMERRYRRLVGALRLVHHLAPWSCRARERLTQKTPLTFSKVRPVAVPAEWWGALHPDVLWPPEEWFGMQYGVRGPLDWIWHRFVSHPARLAAAAASAIAHRLKVVVNWSEELKARLQSSPR